MKILSSKEFKFILGAGGIYGSYMYYGVLQETLFSTKYQSIDGSPNQKFKFPWVILFLQCLFSTLLGMVISRNEKQTTAIGLKEQIQMGFFNSFSMLGSNTALQHMSYPLQALFKSCKILSVLVVGLLCGKTNYPIKQYLCGIIVTAGIVGFNLFESKAGGKETQLIGIVLILVSLFCDGMLADKQNEIRKAFNPSSFKLMEVCSKWCVLFSLIYALAINQVTGLISYISTYPGSIFHITQLGILGCVGQVFIFYTIKHFGPVVLALVTTTRKFFTVLSSIIFFGHSLTVMQWTCVGLVLVGISIELYDSASKRSSSNKKDDGKQSEYTELKVSKEKKDKKSKQIGTVSKIQNKKLQSNNNISKQHQKQLNNTGPKSKKNTMAFPKK